MKKLQVVIDENNKKRICRIIGVYYELVEIDPYDYTILHKIELGTLCFSPRTKKLYYISGVDMPRKLYHRYQGQLPNNEKLSELERMGIYPYDDIRKFVTKYNDHVEKIETEIAIEEYMLDKDIELISRRHKKLSYANQMLINGKKIEELITGSEQEIIIDKETSSTLQISNSTPKQKTRQI